MDLFGFRTFKVDILTDKKSFHVTIRGENPSLSHLFLKEWHEFLEWLAIHVEVNAVFIEPEGNSFFTGLMEEEIKDFTPKELQEHLNKIHRLIYAHYLLPQTIIMDLKEDVQGVGIEFALAADIRIARAGIKFKMNQLQKGIVPSCGGVGILSALVGQSNVRNWILSSQNIDHYELKNSGFILNFYTSSNEDIKNNLYDQIKAMAPVGRIQAKRSMLEAIHSDLHKALSNENTFSHAALSLNDWKKYIENGSEATYSKAVELKKILNNEEISLT